MNVAGCVAWALRSRSKNESSSAEGYSVRPIGYIINVFTWSREGCIVDGPSVERVPGVCVSGWKRCTPRRRRNRKCAIIAHNHLVGITWSQFVRNLSGRLPQTHGKQRDLKAADHHRGAGQISRRRKRGSGNRLSRQRRPVSARWGPAPAVRPPWA